jgi:hypothetical protein
VIPNTPVAWSAFVCGAGPAETGIWGWSDGAAVRRAAVRWQDWPGQRVLLAGLPFLGEQRWDGGRSIGGLAGPTKLAGGSRPAVPPGISRAEAAARWAAHHEQWLAAVADAVDTDAPTLAAVHIDVVDWFSHRFGPDGDESGEAWGLADQFLARLRQRTGAVATVVLSDHGSAPVRGFIRIHRALHAAGLGGAAEPSRHTLAELAQAPVSCRSDYGALWCTEDHVEEARALLFELGAATVLDLPPGLPGRPPRLVPILDDGWIFLLPPELDEDGPGPVVLTEGPAFEALGALNWYGDHARSGLLGTDDGPWPWLADAQITELKTRLCGRSTIRDNPPAISPSR